MGVYSELDIDQGCGDSPFEDDSGIPAFTDSELEGGTPQSGPAPAQTAQETAGSTGDAVTSAAGSENEEEKRKAHEAAEAKRKAEFDARQAAKMAAEQEQLAKLEAMSDEELLAASMKRVSTDTEKLTRRNMKECVAEHIQTMCIEDPAFARKVMHPRKSMIRCFQYISRKAWDYVQDELKANGIQPGPGQQGYGCDVPDDLCYQWGVDYFNDPDAKEDHEDEEKFVPKPYAGGKGSRANSGKTAAKGKEDKKAGTPKKQAESTGQLSLGDFMMPEAKAG